MINQSTFSPASRPLPFHGFTPAAANPAVNNSGGNKHPDNSPVGSVSLSEHGRSLQTRDASLSVNAGTEVTAPDKLARSQQSAQVILGFISAHIGTLAADGASEEELAQAINDGLEGFSSGYHEALSFLDEAGFLTDELSEELALTEQLILGGIEDLRGQFAPNASSENTESETPTSAPVSTTVVSGYQSSYSSTSVVGSGSHQGRVQSQQAAFIENYQKYQSASLEVVTRDGDKVSISYEALQALQRSGAFSESSNENGSEFSAAFTEDVFSSGDFAIRIEGELDEGELTALSDLMNQVTELADEFFNGDFEKAFSMAVELQMDTTELAAMSLNMERSTSYTAAQSYSNVQNLPGNGNEQQQQAPAGLKELGNLVNNLIEMLENANIFAEPTNLLSDLLANRLAQQDLLQPESSTGKIAGMMDQLLSDVAKS